MSLSYVQQKIILNQQLFCIEQEDLLKTVLHRSIGAIVYRNQKYWKGVGSCVLISKNLVITSAHNIYNRKHFSVNKQFRIYFGANGVADKYYEIDSYRYLQKFKSCSDQQKVRFDYALIKLKEDIVNASYLSVSLPCPTCITNIKEQELQIFGFPRDYKDNFEPLNKQGTQVKLRQYGLSRKNRIDMTNAQQCKISYRISTLPGQGGCPLISQQKIIGVHLGSAPNQANVGRLFTMDLIQNLMKWRVELNGDEFSASKQFNCIHQQAINLHIYYSKPSLAEQNKMQSKEETEHSLSQPKDQYLNYSIFERFQSKSIVCQTNYIDVLDKQPRMLDELYLVCIVSLSQQVKIRLQRVKFEKHRSIINQMKNVVYRQQKLQVLLDQVGTLLVSVWQIKLQIEYDKKILKEYQCSQLRQVFNSKCSSNFKNELRVFTLKYQASNFRFMKKQLLNLFKCLYFHTLGVILNQFRLFLLKKEELARQISKCKNLKSFHFFIRFKLYKTKQFECLKQSIQGLEIEDLLICIDPKYFQSYDEGHWASSWIKKQRVEYKEWR